MKEDYVEKYIEELNKKYENDPTEAVRLVSSSVNRLKNKFFLKDKLGMDEKKIDTLISIILTFLLIPIGLMYCNDTGLALGGTIFFIAGLCIGIYVPYIGLIFLCSHGSVGFFMLNSKVIEVLNNSPVLTDPTNFLTPHIRIVKLISAVTIVLLIAHSVSKKVREIKYIRSILMLLIVVSLLLFKLILYKLGEPNMFPFSL